MNPKIKEGYIAPKGICDECGCTECLPVAVLDVEWQLGGWQCPECDNFVDDGTDHVNDIPFLEDVEIWLESDFEAAGWYVV